MSNSALIAENTEKISSHGFEYQTLLERLESLETENKVIKEELEDSKNRSMRKTLIFRNISWSDGLVVKALDSQSRGPVFKNHWVAPWLTQPFILPRSIK